MADYFESFEDDVCRTIGTIIATNRAYGGKILTTFSVTKGNFLVPVSDMDLAEAGIDVRKGVTFSAEVDPSATTPDMIRPWGFAAVDQLQPGETLDSLFSEE